MTLPYLIDGPDRNILLLCDHASNQLAPGICLGLAEEELTGHIAWDIGAAAVTRHLAQLLSCPAILASVSRLVVDCNRPTVDSVVPISDGVLIPGNQKLSLAQLMERHALHQNYHGQISSRIETDPPRLLVAVHSFTPMLAAAPAPRPWPIALLWNQDDLAAQHALAALRNEPCLAGSPIGANEPYSGKLLNYTLNRHAEANGIPYLGVEIRQDLVADKAGEQRFAAILARTIQRVLEAL